MRFMLGGVALSIISAGAWADDFDRQQALNTEVMRGLISALTASDSTKITAIDGRIDYAPDYFTQSAITPVRMVELFAGCTPAPMETALRFRDTTVLKFQCLGREASGPCSTGDLKIMIFQDHGTAVGVSEEQSNAPGCLPPAPPAAPRSKVEQN